ncbi:MAG: hypothetical protein V4858_04325 [Pseudomonadota bacterium]
MENQFCPLCERPTRYGRAREGGFAPKRHYVCECAEFVVDDSGAQWLATLGRENNQGIAETAKAYSTGEYICVITLNREGSVLDFVLSKGLRAEVLR